MKIFAFAAGVLVFGATMAFAQDSGEQQQEDGQAAAASAEQAAVETPPEGAEDDPQQEIVCRTERITGSLTRRRRTCLTRAEWDGLESRSREGFNQQVRQASGGVQCRGDQMGGC